MLVDHHVKNVEKMSEKCGANCQGEDDNMLEFASAIATAHLVSMVFGQSAWTVK